jgi:hypothetical protein
MGTEEAFHPGQIVPQSGIYQCDGECGHQWSTDVKGHRFPPLNEDCKGNGWKLKAKAPV